MTIVDKNSHPDARLAFEELQKAQQEIEDPEKFRIVKNYIKEARDNIFYIQGIKKTKAMGGDDREKIDYKALIEKTPKLGRLIQLEFVRLCQELAYRDRVLGQDLTTFHYRYVELLLNFFQD